MRRMRTCTALLAGALLAGGGMARLQADPQAQIVLAGAPLGDGQQSGPVASVQGGAATGSQGSPIQRTITDSPIDPNALFRLRPSSATTPATFSFTASVIDLLTGQPIPNADIIIAFSPVAFSGGHIHDDANRPKGSFQPQPGVTGCTTAADGTLTCNTGPSASVGLLYQAPQVSGLTMVNASCFVPSGIPCAGLTGNVDVSIDLVAVTAGILIGSTTEHPSNHWGTVSLAQATSNLDAAYLARFATDLQFNDSALQWGGLFDCGANAHPCRSTAQPWNPPHQSHRWGQNQDLDITSVPVPNRNALLHMIDVARMATYQEDAQHWHLTVRY